MKYTNKISKNGQGLVVYEIVLSGEEVVSLKDTLKDAWKRTPQSFETQSYRHRTKAMINELTKIIDTEKIKIPKSTKVTFQ